MGDWLVRIEKAQKGPKRSEARAKTGPSSCGPATLPVGFLRSAVARKCQPQSTALEDKGIPQFNLGTRGTRKLATRNVIVNVVTPGNIETDAAAGLSGDVLEQYVKQIPMERSGSSHQVADFVKFLASDAAAYITDAVIPVDGGLGM